MDEERRPDPSGRTVTIVSGTHDYRSPRRAGVHGLARGFRGLGCRVRFISVRFSPLSLLTNDWRSSLWPRANRIELHEGVECFLWRTAFHPFLRRARAGGLSDVLHGLYAAIPCREFDRLVSQSDFLIVESGLALALVARMRKLNRSARMIYRCSDSLEIIRANPFLSALLRRHGPQFSHIVVPGRGLAGHLPGVDAKVYYAHQGIDRHAFSKAQSNPFSRPINAISVGSMLFDPGFVRAAAAAFPEIEFHLIGATDMSAAPPNVRRYGEMPFEDTLPYLQHATFGFAPYRDTADAHYLAESSLKLTQFAHLGLPAVCPHFAAGGHPHRCGYEPGDAQSIELAVRDALARAGTLTPIPAPTWEDAALRTLFPEAFQDTRVDPARAAA